MYGLGSSDASVLYGVSVAIQGENLWRDILDG